MNLVESLIGVSLLAFITVSTPQYFVMVCHRTKEDFYKSRDAVNDFSLRQEQVAKKIPVPLPPD